MKELISLYVNGENYELAVSPNDTLLDVLRLELRLTGTKKGCDEGDCGACTVLLNGEAIYTADVHPKGMLHGRILGSTVAHGIIKKIDTSKAEALPGVIVVVTGKEAPDRRYGYIEDRHVICKERVRYIHDPVAAVAAVTPQIAEEALSLIDVEYEELPDVFNSEAAFLEDCPVILHDDLPGYKRKPVPLLIYRFMPERPNVFIHRKIRHGDVDEAFEKADYIS